MKPTLLTLITLLMLIPIISFSAPSLAWAQTLEWDANTEPDIAGYQLFLCTEPTFTECKDPIAFIEHPTTTYDISNSAIDPWYARLTAIDTSGNESNFSDILDNVPPSKPTWKYNIEFTGTLSITPLAQNE